MKHILIIGSNSYIGKSFEKHMETYANDTTVIEKTGAADGSWQKVDLGKYDAILHAAALVHKKETSLMQQEYDKINTAFPVEAAKKAKKMGVKQFIFLSTMAVYGDTSDMIDMDTKETPQTYYGQSKLNAEHQLKALADQAFQVIVLRPPMVYGTGCPGNYGRLEKLSRILPIFPQVSNKRSMIYIENLCECIRKAQQERTADYLLLLPQNTEYVNTTELVAAIRRAMGKKVFILPFFNKMLIWLSRKSKTFEKVFGNCCYQKSNKDIEYQIADFKESIQRTVNG